MQKNITKDTQIDTNARDILVLGGSGKTGRRIVQRLRDRHLPVRVGSRSATPAFDWHASENWSKVLENVSALYIAYHPDLAVPGASEHIRELSALAKAKGVERIVLLSGRGEAEAQLCERIVLNSGVAATILRCSWFNQNFTEAFLREMVLTGVIALPVNGIKEPFVDAEDIADVAVAALTETGHAGKIYELTGPRLLSFRDVANELSNVTGRDIQFVSIPHSRFLQSLKEAALPEEMIRLIDYLFSEILDGRNASLGDGVRQALGRSATDFSVFAKRASHADSWHTSD